MPITTCPIWGTRFEATGHYFDRTRTFRVDSSPRAGGGYSIDGVLVSSEVSSLSDQEKARLTTWLVDQRALGDIQPKITRASHQLRLGLRRPLPVHERAERLLKLIALNSGVIGNYVNLFQFSHDESLPGARLAISAILLSLLTLLFFRRWLGQNRLPLKRLTSSWVT